MATRKIRRALPADALGIHESHMRSIREVCSMIAEARNQGVVEINLESTLTAHDFYKRMGFVDSGPQAILELGGSKVRYIPMKMKLINS